MWGKSAQVARAMNQMKIQIMGISECQWIGAGRMKLSSGETVLYLQDCINLDSRRAMKMGQTKDKMEKDGREKKGKSLMEKLE